MALCKSEFFLYKVFALNQFMYAPHVGTTIRLLFLLSFHPHAKSNVNSV